MVGDKFTLRFTGSNAAYAPSVSKPRIVFDNVRICVAGTDYAQPIKGTAWYFLPETKLFPGESSSVDVEFEAKKDMHWMADLENEEHVARAWIRGDLDQNKFFQIWNYFNIYEEIESWYVSGSIPG